MNGGMTELESRKFSHRAYFRSPKVSDRFYRMLKMRGLNPKERFVGPWGIIVLW